MSGGSTSDWLHLSEDDEVVWSRRPHPIAMGSMVAIGGFAVVVGVVVAGWSWSSGYELIAWLGLATAAVGAGVVGVRYVHWTNTRYVITTEELYEKRGVVSRNVTQFRLDRVQNMTLQQSVAGRLLGYGDLTVYTAGSGDPELTFARVPDPGDASKALSDQLGEISATTQQPAT